MMQTKTRILVGGDELFYHPDVIAFYDLVLEKWVSTKDIALFMGCSMHKPYSNSFMHRKVIKMLEKHNLSDKVQQYIVGEPLVIVPREWEEIYPAAHYDFPPELLTERGKEIFVQRLRIFLRKAVSFHKFFVIFAPNHHKKIILEAMRGIIEPIVVPYNLYYLPLLLRTLKEVLK